MSSSVKEKITTDLNQAKEVGQLRAERIREIVKSAIAQLSSELRAGSGDIGPIIKDAISTVIENVRSKGGEMKEDVTASIEGVIEGISSSRRQN
ncbi:MAG: histidine kinase, partial [Leptolyngbyaceae bacterium]|nr:histidine kinase [Leptolyngbyaceae bacterium]